MRYRVLAALALVAGCSPSPPRTPTLAEGEQTVKDVGFVNPSAAFHDAIADLYFVSNVSGGGTDSGFVSVLRPDGVVQRIRGLVEEQGVALRAPRGLAASGDKLFVLDGSRVLYFDRSSGASAGYVEVPGATDLYGLVASPVDGSLFFTDRGIKGGSAGGDSTGSDAVYHLTFEGRLETLARGATLGHPAGIGLSGDSVWVASWEGEVYRIVDGTKADVVKLPTGRLTGLVVFGGEAFIASDEGSVIYRGLLGGPFHEMVAGVESPGAIGHDEWRNQLLIPLPKANALRLIPLVVSPRAGAPKR